MGYDSFIEDQWWLDSSDNAYNKFNYFKCAGLSRSSKRDVEVSNCLADWLSGWNIKFMVVYI